MSCYLRRMKDILDEAGVTITSENKKELDQWFHKLAGVGYKNCSPTWKELKIRLEDTGFRKDIVESLKSNFA